MNYNDVIPSFYTPQPADEIPYDDGGAWNNDTLRMGEVKRIISPSDVDSRSKLFFEYDVLVAHQENGTAINKIYHNCILYNTLAGLADYCTYTLRKADNQDSVFQDVGSRVLLLCMDGNPGRGVIIGGIRFPEKKDTKKGHFFEWEFNGVHFEVNDDGSFSVTNKGKTNAKGEADSKRNKDGSGTTVKVEANGNFSVTSPNGKQKITIDHKSNKMEIEADLSLVVKAKTVTLDAAQINLGGGGGLQPSVKGSELAKILAQLCSVIGPTLPSPTQKAQIAKLIPKIPSILSKSVKGG